MLYEVNRRNLLATLAVLTVGLIPSRRFAFGQPLQSRIINQLFVEAASDVVLAKVRPALSKAINNVILSAAANYGQGAMLSAVQRTVQKHEHLITNYVGGNNNTFDGVIDRSAAIALQLSALSITPANSIRSSGKAPPVIVDIENFTSRLPQAEDVPYLMRSAMTGLIGSIADGAIPDMLPEIAGHSVTEAPQMIVGALPSAVRPIATAMLAIARTGEDGRAHLEQLLSTGLKTAFGQAKQQSATLASSIRAGTISYGNTLKSMEGVSNQIAAVACIGSFLFSDVFQDKQSARRFSDATQFASLALSIGLMVSSGGLGAVAGTGGFMGALQGLQSIFGAGSSPSGATEVALQQLAEQIAELRTTMVARFDRLEAKENQALQMLGQIAAEIRQMHIEVNVKLDALRLELAELRRYVVVADRQTKIEKFNLLAGNVKLLIENQSSSELAVTNQTKALYDLLRYALDDAQHISLVRNPEATLKSAVQTANRVDLAVALVNKAGNVLRLTNVPHIETNPVEWCRAMQAFVEAHTCLPNVRSAVLIKPLWSHTLEGEQFGQT